MWPYCLPWVSQNGTKRTSSLRDSSPIFYTFSRTWMLFGPQVLWGGRNSFVLSMKTHSLALYFGYEEMVSSRNVQPLWPQQPRCRRQREGDGTRCTQRGQHHDSSILVVQGHFHDFPDAGKDVMEYFCRYWASSLIEFGQDTVFTWCIPQAHQADSFFSFSNVGGLSRWCWMDGLLGHQVYGLGVDSGWSVQDIAEVFHPPLCNTYFVSEYGFAICWSQMWCARLHRSVDCFELFKDLFGAVCVCIHLCASC